MLALCGWALPMEVPTVEENIPTLRNTCNSTLLYLDTIGTITSPNFPQNYPNGVDSYWFIGTSAGTVIYLSFDSFLVETNVDYIRVRMLHFQVL